MRSNVTPPAVKSELLIIYPSYEYGVGVESQNNVRFLSAGQGGQIRSDSCCPRCSTFGRQTARTWKIMYLGGVKSRSIPAPLRLGVARSLCNNFDSNPQVYLEKFYRKLIGVIDLLKYHHSSLQIFLFKIENRGNFILVQCRSGLRR